MCDWWVLHYVYFRIPDSYFTKNCKNLHPLGILAYNSAYKMLQSAFSSYFEKISWITGQNVQRLQILIHNYQVSLRYGDVLVNLKVIEGL